MVATTDQDFKQVADNTAKVVNLVGEIASASKEQSIGIEQINKAAVDMSSVTQKMPPALKNWRRLCPCLKLIDQETA